MQLKPIFNFSIGYSKSNIGDEVYYIDPVKLIRFQEWIDLVMVLQLVEFNTW